jgi:hypothetical protein
MVSSILLCMVGNCDFVETSMCSLFWITVMWHYDSVKLIANTNMHSIVILFTVHNICSWTCLFRKALFFLVCISLFHKIFWSRIVRCKLIQFGLNLTFSFCGLGLCCDFVQHFMRLSLHLRSFLLLRRLQV